MEHKEAESLQNLAHSLGSANFYSFARLRCDFYFDVAAVMLKTPFFRSKRAFPSLNLNDELFCNFS
jgi:hypothetical protein